MRGSRYLNRREREAEAMKWREKFDEEKHYGLTEIQSDFLYNLVLRTLTVMDDSRDRHFALMVLTRENTTDEEDIISTSMITTMNREFLHDALRTWLHKETQ
jgi:hypothetical protein